MTVEIIFLFSLLFLVMLIDVAALVYFKYKFENYRKRKFISALCEGRREPVDCDFRHFIESYVWAENQRRLISVMRYTLIPFLRKAKDGERLNEKIYLAGNTKPGVYHDNKN